MSGEGGAVVAAGCAVILLWVALVLALVGGATWLITHIIVSAVQ